MEASALGIKKEPCSLTQPALSGCFGLLGYLGNKARR